MLRRSWRAGVLVMISAALFAWTFQTGRALGMAESLPANSFTRAEMSIAVALSRLVYGAPGYILYSPVVGALIEGGFRADAINNPGQINRAIDHARHLQFVANCSVPQTCAEDWGDDKGYADFAMLAFRLFGFRIESFYYLYFLVLAVSLTIFGVDFFREPERLIFMPLFLAAHYITVVILPDSMVTFVLHDARFLPALSTTAALHVGLIALRSAAVRVRTLTLAICQIPIIVLAIDGRASAKWQVIFVVALAAVGLLRGRSVRVGQLLLVALTVAAVLGLDAYKRLAYDQRYLRDGIPSHVIWHNVYMGFGVHPEAVTRFGLNPTDATSYRHAHRFLQEHPEAGRALGIDGTKIAYPVFTDVGWRKYDEIVRTMYFRFWRDNPEYALETYTIYKPKYLVQQVLWQAGLTSRFPRWVAVDDAVLPARRNVFNPLRPVAAIVVAIAIAVVGGRAMVGEWIIACGALFLASLIPSFVVAPFYYELPPMYVALGLFGYVATAALLVRAAGIVRPSVAL